MHPCCLQGLFPTCRWGSSLRHPTSWPTFGPPRSPSPDYLPFPIPDHPRYPGALPPSISSWCGGLQPWQGDRGACHAGPLVWPDQGRALLPYRGSLPRLLMELHRFKQFSFLNIGVKSRDSRNWWMYIVYHHEIDMQVRIFTTLTILIFNLEDDNFIFLELKFFYKIFFFSI